MNRRALLSSSVALTLLLFLNACGLSPRSDVIDDGPGPGAGVGVPTPEIQPADWSRGLSADILVDQYLAAAAGDHSKLETRQVVINRLRTYQVAQKLPNWKPSGRDGDVNIIRVLERSPVPGKDIVEVRAMTLGVLDASGRIKSANPAKTVVYQFSVAEDSTRSYQLVGVPDMLLLSEDALKKYYDARLVYFPSADGTRLLPDLRYLAWAVPTKEERATHWVRFALGEPSGWLKPAVAALGARPIGSVVERNGELVVDVSVQADAGQLIALFNCLSRTLDGVGRVVLKVEGQDKSKEVGDPSWKTGATNPKKYAIYNGSVREQTGSLVLLPANNHLTAAAIARGGAMAAVVQTVRDGEQLRIGPTGPEAPATPVAVLTAAKISQPIWLDRETNHAVLVLADNVLHKVTTGGEKQTIALPGGVKASYISVAPDGHRIAYVAGDRLYVAVLQRNGTSLVVNSAEALPISLHDLQGVAFSSLSTLVVAGQGTDDEGKPKVMLVNYSIDGIWQGNTPARFRPETPISGLVAAPEDDMGENPTERIMFVLNGTAVSGAFATPTNIRPLVLPAPTPTASPGTKSAGTVTATAPSFEG